MASAMATIGLILTVFICAEFICYPTSGSASSRGAGSVRGGVRRGSLPAAHLDLSDSFFDRPVTASHEVTR